VPLHSFFALVSDAPALQLVAEAQALFVKAALSSTNFADLPLLSSVAPFKAGGRGGPENYTDVPAGDVMLRHAADLYIYPNTSAAIRLNGAEIAEWLEYAAGIFNQIPPGSTDAPLINPDFPSFNFEMIFGLRFQIDLSKPPRFDVRGARINPQSTRIAGLSFAGAPLDPHAVFAVATNSYRASTNTGDLAFAEDRVLFQSTESNLNVVLSYFANHPTPAKIAAPNARFVAMPGTSVIFDTSPKAVDHLADLPGMMIEPVGPTQTGFLRFRLHL
jgi:2',3'-cyclic-nucleotide 2'-phosphodiesterase / 3'-nucleotidase